jgi:hypothetical protein
MYAIYAETEELAKLWAEQLLEAGIAAEVPVLSLGGVVFQNVTFPAADRAKALEVLGLAEPLPCTPVDGTAYELLVPQRVVALLAPGENASAVRAALTPYAEELGTYIVVTNGRGGYVPVQRTSDVLRIHIYAFPALQAAGIRQPQVQYLQIPTIFGVGLPPGVCDGLTPTGLGKPLVAPDENVTVAEVFDGTLYVFLNLTYPCPASSELIRSVLCPLMELYLQASHPRSTSQEDPRTLYARACARRLHLRRVLLESRIEELGEEIARASHTLIEKTRGRRQALEELHMLKHRTGALEASFEGEYDELYRSPHIRRIEVTSSQLVVGLDHIMVDYAGQRHRLGPYRLLVPLDGGRVRIQSKRPRLYSDSRLYHHPHVWGSEGEQICYGDVAADVPKLLAEREYGLAIDLLIDFLHEVNENEQRAWTVLQGLWKPLDRPMLCTCERADQTMRREG